MTLRVAGASATLPFAGATDAEPTITAFQATMFSATGVMSAGATMTWTSGLIIDVVSTECAACTGGRRLELNVKVDAAEGFADVNSLCGGGSGAAVKVTCNVTTTPFGGCATVPTTAMLTTACTSGLAAYAAPASGADAEEGAAVCLQCSQMGIEGNCLAQLAALGTAATGPIADVCRARFRNIYGQARSKVLDNYAPLWGTSAAGRAAAAGGIADTITRNARFPSMAAFDRAAASAAAITESEYSLNMVKFVAGRVVTSGAVSKTRGIPYTKEGSTAGRARWPFPSIQDECRGAGDAVTGGGGFVLHRLLHQVSMEQMLRVRMCGSQFPAQVAIYEKDYVAVTDAVTDADKTITFSFTPWHNNTKYEVRIEYHMSGAATGSIHAVTVGGAALGGFAIVPPALATGVRGFETQGLSVTGAAVVVTLTPAAGATAPAVGIITITVRAANPAQIAKNYPAFAGYTQTTCGVFLTERCGDLTFVARANAEYFVALTGRGVAEGAYSFQLEKVYGTITTLMSVSNNPATSKVSSYDGNAVREVGGKLATVGDTLTVTVRSGRTIDKPSIRVNGVAVPSGLVTGTGRVWQATFVIRAIFGFTDGPLTVTARPPPTLSEPSRGFGASMTPQGADKVLVMFDGTPPSMATALIVNAAYLTPLNANAPAACTDSIDVQVTTAKSATIGDVVVVVFHATEPILGVSAAIGGVAATVLMDSISPAPALVQRVRDAWRATLEGLRVASSPAITDETFGVAYATLTDQVVQQGSLAFSVDYTDAAGNVGLRLTTVTGAPPGASAASTLNDRLRSDSVQFDSFTPTRAGDVMLSHVNAGETSANAAMTAGAFHAVQQVRTLNPQP